MSWPLIAPVASAGISGLIIAEHQQPPKQHQSGKQQQQLTGGGSVRGKEVSKERRRRSLRGKVSRSRLFRRRSGGRTQSPQTPKDIRSSDYIKHKLGSRFLSSLVSLVVAILAS